MHNCEYFIPFQSHRLTTFQDAVDLNKLIISFLFPPLPFLMPIPISVGLTPRLLHNFLSSPVCICESYISPLGPETDCSSRHWLPWISAFLSPFFTFWYICTCSHFFAASQTLLLYFLILYNGKYVLSLLFIFLQFATYDSNLIHNATLLSLAFLLPFLPFSFTIMLAFVHQEYCDCITLKVEAASPYEVSVHVY